MPSTVHLLSLPPRLPDRVWLLELSHNNLSCLPGGSFQGLWGLGAADFSQCPVGSGWWSTGGPGFLGAARPQPQPAGLLAPGLLGYLGFSALPGPLSQLLATLDPCSLWGLGDLKQLNLSHNQLAELGTVGLGASFTYTGSCCLSTSCSKLVQLWPPSQAWWSSLTGNNISKLETEPFAALWALGLLTLVGNCLQHLEFKVMVDIWTAGTWLLLASNLWVCNCDLQRAFGKLGQLWHLCVADLGTWWGQC